MFSMRVRGLKRAETGQRGRNGSEGQKRVRRRGLGSEGMGSVMSTEAVASLDRELAGLARADGAQRLRVGDALGHLKRRSWFHELGFSSMGAYVIERCGRSARWGDDSRTLARRVSGLPVLRAALVSGRLGWSMVELLARHATPENESDLAARASRATFREMRASLRDDVGMAIDERATVTLTMSADDAWLFEHTRWLFKRVEPGVDVDQLVHWLAVEGLTSLRELVPDGEMTEYRARSDALSAKAAAWREQRRAWRDEAERRVEGRLDLEAPASDLEEWERGTDAWANARALDAHIRDVCQEIAARDVLFGALAERFWKSDGWRRLGYASEAQYASERLAMSLSSVKTKRLLARKAKRMPRIATALEGREIGFEAALLVTRVATDATVDAWVARATARTVKLLREEVHAAELRIRLGGARDQLPPSEEELEELARRRRAASARLRASDRAPFAVRAWSVLRQMSAESPSRARFKGQVRYRFGVTRDTYELWSTFEECAEAARGWLPSGVTPIRLVCAAFAVEWSHVLRNDVAYANIYARDGFECRSPLCTRRDVTPHHLRFRSQGGGDEDDNLVSLCVWCHLFGVHEGRISARPPASNVRWQLGREPILVVDGRVKAELRADPCPSPRAHA